MTHAIHARLAVGLLIACALNGAVWTHAAGPSDFSADILFSGPEGQMEGRMHVAEGKIRFEILEQVMITRVDKNVTWVLMPSEGMYLEQPIDPKTLAQSGSQMPGEVERVRIAEEAVNGQPAVKYRLTSVTGGRTYSVYQWIAETQPLPLRVQDIDGQWTVEYRNVRVGPQPAELFEPPAGMQKFAMPDFSQYAQMALESQGS